MNPILTWSLHLVFFFVIDKHADEINSGLICTGKTYPSVCIIHSCNMGHMSRFGSTNEEPTNVTHSFGWHSCCLFPSFRSRMKVWFCWTKCATTWACRRGSSSVCRSENPTQPSPRSQPIHTLLWAHCSSAAHFCKAIFFLCCAHWLLFRWC